MAFIDSPGSQRSTSSLLRGALKFVSFLANLGVLVFMFVFVFFLFGRIHISHSTCVGVREQPVRFAALFHVYLGLELRSPGLAASPFAS